MRVKCENPLGFLKTEKTHLLKKRRRKRIRRYEDYRLHHARARVIWLMTRTNPIDEEQDHRCGQAGSQRNNPVCPQAA
nr:MAG TPA: hypothetical protein [Caudoviricetes sp.]